MDLSRLTYVKSCDFTVDSTSYVQTFVCACDSSINDVVIACSGYNKQYTDNKVSEWSYGDYRCAVTLIGGFQDNMKIWTTCLRKNQ